MFIQTEDTPNPNSLKFLPGQPVLESGTADFRDSVSAQASPLAKALFAVEGVAGVFLASDFITITKNDTALWEVLRPSIIAAIMDHALSGLPAVAAGAVSVGGDDDDEVVAQIKELLETRVRPTVAQDGGDITFVRFEDGIVYVQMQGACSGCPSSTATLKAGIENMLRYYLPEVVEVRAA